MSATVDEMLLELEERVRKLKDTRCARCGHRFRVHYLTPAYWCLADRWNAPQCRCKRFIDPDEVLAMPEVST